MRAIVFVALFAVAAADLVKSADLPLVASETGRPSAAVLDIISRYEADESLRADVERYLARGNHVEKSEGRRLAGFHSVFDVTCHPGESGGCMYLEWRWYGLWLSVLVIATVVIEMVLHHLEHMVGSDGESLTNHIYHKMIKELALLGLVSFFAIIVGNTPIIGAELKAGSQWRFLMLEIAHVMVFVMALFFCLLIALIYKIVKAIEAEWYHIEDPKETIYDPDHDTWAAAAAVLGTLNEGLPHVRRGGAALSASTPVVEAEEADESGIVMREISFSAPQRETSRRRASNLAKSITKNMTPTFHRALKRARRQAEHFVLAFQFRRCHRLHNVKSFVYAHYLKKKLHKHIVAILEPSWITWLLLFVLGLGVFLGDSFCAPALPLLYRRAFGAPFPLVCHHHLAAQPRRLPARSSLPATPKLACD